MAITFRLEIVNPEAKIFSGLAEMLVITGVMGELGILAGHAPLLTKIKPGQIRIVTLGGEEELYYVSGGILEVQPSIVTILADTVIRATDLDEAAAVQAKNQAEIALANRKSNADFSTLIVKLAQATAQIRTIKLAHKNQEK